jgi:thymidine kinase
MVGEITALFGTMYGGKSTAGVERLLASDADVKVIVSSSVDSRGIVSRNHKKDDLPKDTKFLDIVTVADYLIDILQHDGKSLFVFVDEVHLFDHKQLDWLKDTMDLAGEGKLELVMAGLTTDQHGVDFPVAELISDYEGNGNISVEFFNAPCFVCGKDGNSQVRKWYTEDRITDDYVVVCKEHHKAFLAYDARKEDITND